jgi:hypothetical protein
MITVEKARGTEVAVEGGYEIKRKAGGWMVVEWFRNDIEKFFIERHAK